MPADPAARGGAKALLLTVLGEFVLPTGGSVWTSTLVAAADALGIGEKNARQAIARTADQGLITSERHGRSVRWSLTADGRTLLESGSERIYGFGQVASAWDGRWLIANCQISELPRAQRHRVRTRLGFLGFGELTPTLFVSPHADRELQLCAALRDLDVFDHSMVMQATMSTPHSNVVETAWNLGSLDDAYSGFVAEHAELSPTGDADAFAAVVNLVHDWRRFPSIDPELPRELLPADWSGMRAATLFRERRQELIVAARRWFSASHPTHQ